MGRRLVKDRSGRSCEGWMRMHHFRSRCPAAAGLALGAAAVAHIGASSAAVRAEACEMIVQTAGNRNLVLQEDGPGRTVVEGSCRASCGVRRCCRDRWRGRDRYRVDRA